MFLYLFQAKMSLYNKKDDENNSGNNTDSNQVKHKYALQL